MDKNEICMMLEERYHEEMNDYNFYKEWSGKARDMCQDTFASIFKDISREERTHACIIKHLLEHYKERT